MYILITLLLTCRNRDYYFRHLMTKVSLLILSFDMFGTIYARIVGKPLYILNNM